jgi:hypothetical protein
MVCGMLIVVQLMQYQTELAGEQQDDKQKPVAVPGHVCESR